MAQRFYAGRTDPHNTHWEDFSSNVICVDVDTSAANFSGTPMYFVSLGGRTEHAQMVGVSNLYPPGPPPATDEERKKYPEGPTARGFRVYINDYTARPLTAQEAKDHLLHINWIGIEEV